MRKIVLIGFIFIAVLFYNIGLNSKTYNKEESKNIEIFNSKEQVEKNIKNFESIKIGDSKKNVLELIGEPGRIDKSEYDFFWYVYNQYKENFAMVGIKNDSVVALYSNSLNTSEIKNIKINDNKDAVNSEFESLEFKRKGNTRYMINSENQYDIVKFDNKYITFFYDVYENNRVCSYQVIDENTEMSLEGIYPKESEEIKKSFELQIIDLTNSVRYKKNLNGLKYSESATNSSVKHSTDMACSNFFDHKNKREESPFDRMKKEGISYVAAGENIAAGQTSAIYAHEAWMNSEGHRKNILGDYNNIGVGVAFGGHYKIYYTQNFYK
ncbi:CAP domain-containing protein [Romboutsia lituseburensis]|uniref:CAP domain-containing protein n=1 Tax=Romboutsia lituseburensis TaxID=1537 RepID=UPI00215A8B0D|nr:CAP domain-containing protein [Romboutsia lituseburensis]MCR8745004.1 CAP domain-containing protein [Romboutsia lituseburensis]